VAASKHVPLGAVDAQRAEQNAEGALHGCAASQAVMLHCSAALSKQAPLTAP
jgi:hypothetical protein